MINNEVVHHFTLPNHERTSVHNRDNWLYGLEGQSESPTPPKTHHAYEYHPTHLSDAHSHASSARAIPPANHAIAVNTLRTEVTAFRDDVTAIRKDFHSFMDVAYEQFNHIYQEIYFIRRFSYLDVGQSGWFLLEYYRISILHLNSKDTAPLKCGGGYYFPFLLF